jgi:hypothetical protein
VGKHDGGAVIVSAWAICGGWHNPSVWGGRGNGKCVERDASRVRTAERLTNRGSGSSVNVCFVPASLPMERLENLRRSDQTWKVRMIEEEFQRLMFDVEAV